VIGLVGPAWQLVEAVLGTGSAESDGVQLADPAGGDAARHPGGRSGQQR